MYPMHLGLWGVGSERFVHANRPLGMLIRQMLQMFRLPHSLDGYKKWCNVSVWVLPLSPCEARQTGMSADGGKHRWDIWKQT